MNPVTVGLLGLGTVGGGTATVLQRNAQEIERRAGRGIVVGKALVRDPERTRHPDVGAIALTTAAADVVAALHRRVPK